ncbi:efflux RND transporter permease subunit [Tepidamorphus sp. 3E244]|uniref:efflux RND transporter permease subunit n=1 Tax=Tepidamorphus sp. 3E244 TaxID=3385498 RepID=UPI0038FCB861
MRAAHRCFSLETIGLISARYPAIMLAALALVTVLAAAGIPRLGFDSEIRNVFQADNTSNETLDREQDAFGAADNDLLVLVEGEALFTPAGLKAFRDFALDSQLVSGVASTISMFAIPGEPSGAQRSASLFPVDLANVPDIDGLKRTVTTHPLAADTLISDDGEAALLVVTLAPTDDPIDASLDVTGDLDDIARTTLAQAGLTHVVTGFPAIRATVVGILTDDQFVFRIAALVIAILLALAFFMHAGYLVLSVLPVAVSTVWLLGGMGWAREDITVVTNVVPTLVMVVTFSNAVHLLLGVRRARIAGVEKHAAIEDAVRTVGPATVMTAVTTAIALLSLALIDRPAIASFGIVGALGATGGCLLVLTLVPALATYLLGPTNPEAELRRANSGLSGVVRRAGQWTARFVVVRAVILATLGVVLLLVSAWFYWLNGPRFRYGDNLPVHSEVSVAARAIDTRLAGSSSLDLLVTLPDGVAANTTQALDIARAAGDVLRGHEAIRSVWSLDVVADWYARGSGSRADLLAEIGSAPMLERLANAERGLLLVTGHIRDTEASDLLALAARIEPQLAELRDRFPGAAFELTGTALHTARSATQMIDLLSWSLLAAIAMIIVLIGLSLRSLAYGALTILPNLLPIGAAGTYLYLTGQQLQFTSIIIFTISFGIAVDSTIHILNHHRARRSTFTDGQKAVEATIATLTPALVLATLALMGGAVTMLSPLPMSQLYGELIVIVLVAALAGDLVFLPALLALFERWKARATAAQ